MLDARLTLHVASGAACVDASRTPQVVYQRVNVVDTRPRQANNVKNEKTHFEQKRFLHISKVFLSRKSLLRAPRRIEGREGARRMEKFPSLKPSSPRHLLLPSKSSEAHRLCASIPLLLPIIIFVSAHSLAHSRTLVPSTPLYKP
jgi:hypothetical protein